MANPPPRRTNLAVFASGGAGAFVARAGGAGGTLLAHLLIVRLAGGDAYGAYVYVSAWVSVFMIGATLGLDTAALRFVAEYSALRDWPRLRGFITMGIGIAATVAIAGAAAIGLGTLALRGQLSAELSGTILAGCLLLPILTVLQVVAMMIRGQKRVLASLIPLAIARPLLLAATLAMAAGPLGLALTAARVMAFDAAVTAIMLLASLLLLWRGLPPEARAADGVRETRLWVGVAVPMVITASLRLAMGKTDILLIGAIVGTTASGSYALASQMASLVGFPLLAANTISAPMFSEYHAREDRRGLQEFVTFATRSVTVVAAVTALLVLLGAPFVLASFGPAFEAAYVPLAILVLGQIVNAASGAVGFMLGMMSQERVAARATTFTAVLNVALNALMIPWFGLVGAALATTASGTAWNLILARRVTALLGIHPTVLGGRPGDGLKPHRGARNG